MWHMTEQAAGEYDIVKCPAGTPVEDCVFLITAHFQVKDMDWSDPKTPPADVKGVNLIYAGGHCHAPSCISMELYNADTGQLICRQTPTFGNGTEIFNEKGYIAIPPCLWGSAEEGLVPPAFLSMDTNLTSIKKNNNTYCHYGEMAMW